MRKNFRKKRTLMTAKSKGMKDNKLQKLNFLANFVNFS